jgi:Tol biopolymer transport system component
MPLSSGTRVGSYEVVGLIGAGGMGEVYRARDPRLGRDVAVKLLPASVAGDADRRARFEREARLLASLNHPNIAQIFGVEDGPGGPALVMELVEGPTLAERIAAAGAVHLGIDEVVAIARQIVDGLEAAHDQGVVHRDLKPANIKVRPDGTVKVLDFGLAKAMADGPSQAEGPYSGGQPANSPTVTAHATQAGVILGTAAYMSPEQARGRPVDRRADIWAFGCVLYELLAGVPAFARESITDTLSAITRDEPPPAPIAQAPSVLRGLIRRCLEKDPRVRLRDIGEARIILSGDLAGVTPDQRTDRAGSVPASASRRWLPIAAALLAVAAAAGGATWAIVGGRGADARLALEAAFTQITADAGLTFEPAVSPNGSLLAYASDRGGAGLDLWVQPLPTGEPVQITRDAADDREPSFSPDGSRIVFRSDRNGGGIYIVPALGGSERLVAPRGREPRFSPDGKRISYITGGRGAEPRLWIVDEAGGEPRMAAADLLVASNLWAADGVGLIVLAARKGGELDLWRIDAATGAAAPLLFRAALKEAGLVFENAGAPSALVNGYLLFPVESGATASLWAIGVSADGRRLSGPPHKVTAGTRYDRSPSVVTAPDGTRLYFASLDERANLHVLPVTANAGRVTGAMQPLTEAAATDFWPSVSADGTRLVFNSTRHSGGVWLKDLGEGRETPLSQADDRMAGISPDGLSVAVFRSASRAIAILPAAGGPPRVLKEQEGGFIWDWPTPTLLIAGRGTLNAINPETGASRPLLADAKGQYYGHGRLSPDGRFVSAMEWVSADRARIIVFPFRDTPVPPAEWIAVTDGATVAEEHAWSPDGSLLYIVSERDGYRCLWAQRLDAGTKQPRGEPTPLAHFHSARRQMIGTASSPQRLALAPGGLVFSMQERRGNIWMATIAR